MIISISGGLGNQLFEYAFAYARSQKTDKKIVLDCFMVRRDPQRRLMLNQYDIKYDRISYFRGALHLAVRKIIKQEKMLSVWDNISHTMVETESLSYLPIEDNKNYFIGTWINTGYFENYRKDILRLLKYKGTFNSKQTEMLKKIKAENSLAIHVRRGDYLCSHNSAYHNVSLNYYINSIKYLREKYEIESIYVFSDDIEWCKESPAFVDNVTFVDSDISGKACIDIELMRNCKYFVIANSTFSWWGAWLSERQEKVMIAPDIWFNGEENRINNEKVKTALLNGFLIIEE